MPVFNKIAYLAACQENLPAQVLDGTLSDKHFETYVALDEALSWLNNEQRCDALYADHIIELNDVSALPLLAIRDLVVGKGALDANYLAELVQNADDSSDGQSAEINVLFDGDWLLFSNNGRKIDAGNLRGLTRFFAHSQPISERTIGKFGIGFKSCYRIATEVFVYSWDSDGSFAFRLPIFKPEYPDSLPDASRLRRIVNALGSQGLDVPDRNVVNDRLGYCTPEYISSLPTDLKNMTRNMISSERGSLFCLHLHNRGQQDVKERLPHARDIFSEISPLFLPNLKKISVGSSELSLHVHQRQQVDCIDQILDARRITITAQRDDDSKLTQRLWLLEGKDIADLWKLAIHTDSSFRIAPISGACVLPEGGAYAFFPLNDENRSWPLKLHLHIDCPTTLSRGSWSDDERSSVENQIRRSARSLAAWLEVSESRLQDRWSVHELFRREPDAKSSSGIFYHALMDAGKARRIYRTLWGAHVSSDSAVSLSVSDNDNLRQSWAGLVDQLRRVRFEHDIVPAHENVDFGIVPINASELKELFDFLTSAKENKAAYWQNVFLALLSVSNISPNSFEYVLGRIPVEKRNGTFAMLRELMIQQSGAELLPSWHETFKNALNWSPDLNRTVCGNSLRSHLKRLSVSQAVIEWDEVKSKLSSHDDWDRLGAKFWGDPHDPCPYALRKEVLNLLMVKDGTNTWKPLKSTWLINSVTPICLGEVISFWLRPDPLNDNARKEIVRKLSEWVLFDEYVSGIEHRIANQFPDALYERLDADGFGTLTHSGFAESLKNLEPRWQALVKTGVENAVSDFLNKHCAASETLLSFSIPAPLRQVITCLPEYKSNPGWLTLDVERLIYKMRLPQNCHYSVLTLNDLTVPTKQRIAKQLLANLFRWDSLDLSVANIDALNDVFRDVTGTWEVRTAPANPKHLNQFIDFTSNAGPEFNLHISNNGEVDWRESAQLPAPLPQIKNIQASCITLDGLTRKVIHADDTRPISWVELSPDMQDHESLISIRDKHLQLQFVYTSHLSISWYHGNRKVCEITEALFALDGNVCYVSKANISSDESQSYADVIANYLALGAEHDAKDVESYRNTHLPAETYGKYRERILKAFRRTFVSDAGYKIEHVLRELLQNTESAYASQSDNPVELRFEVKISERSADGSAEVVIEHDGRGFNELDKNGSPRDDIRRIVSTAPLDVAVEDEVGRFNRGFKSVFSITDSVHVESNGYQFDIRDYLLIFPKHPVQVSENHSPTTSFSFGCKVSAVDDLLGWQQNAQGYQRVSVFNMFTFVFLRYISFVKVTRSMYSVTWTLIREQRGDECTRLRVLEGENRFICFDVYSISPKGFPYKPNDRVDIAIQLNRENESLPVASRGDHLYITFPTATKSPVAFLVNAPFDVDPGRIGILPNSRNAGLIKEAFTLALKVTKRKLHDSPDIRVWLAFVSIWNIRDAESWVDGHFSDDSLAVRKILGDVRDFLLESIPHDGELCPANALIVPSAVMSVISEVKGDSWPLRQDKWVSDAVIDALRKLSNELPRYRLPDFIDDIRSDKELLREIQDSLDDSVFIKNFSKSIIEHQELDAARDKLKALLDVSFEPFVVPDLNVYFEPDYRPERSVEELYAWWVRHEDIDPYVLEGAWWRLLCPDTSSLAATERKNHLKRLLSCPDSEDGRMLWYKVLSIPCLMSSGRRVESLQNFWDQNLISTEFFRLTAQAFHSDETERIFMDVIHSQLNGPDASGENADYWRRVFYDMRKIRTLVYENSFAEVIMDLASDSHHLPKLLDFLRTGTLPGQRSWAGVIGQSAGAPLFFVMRELRRLGVIGNDAADPSCYFVCKPVRRAAYYLGWIDKTLRNKYDFASLQEISAIIHEIIINDKVVGDEMLHYYDIPLMHYYQEGMN